MHRTSDVLRASLRKLLSSKVYARGYEGLGTCDDPGHARLNCKVAMSPYAAETTSWCARGALRYADVFCRSFSEQSGYGKSHYDEALEYLHRAGRYENHAKYTDGGLASWFDSLDEQTWREDAEAVFKQAIVLAEVEGD